MPWFFQKLLDISTSNFYWVIERSKSQRSVVLIFCDFTYFIFNKLETVSIARSVMMRLWHPLKLSLAQTINFLFLHYRSWVQCVDSKYDLASFFNIRKKFYTLDISKFWHDGIIPTRIRMSGGKYIWENGRLVFWKHLFLCAYVMVQLGISLNIN